MQTGGARLIVGVGLLLLGAVATQQCSSKAVPEPPELKPIVSIKELMENIIYPIADYVFDAVGTDLSAKGVV